MQHDDKAPFTPPMPADRVRLSIADMNDAAHLPALLTLPSGDELPALGLGTWRMGEDRATHAAELAALRLALDMGWRVFDTAEMYGEGGAESAAGRRRWPPALRGGLRAGLAVHRVQGLPHNASDGGVVRACERSLQPFAAGPA